MPPEGIHVHGRQREAADLLRSRGLRVTQQRLSIWDALAPSHGSHLSAEELTERVRTDDPSVHLATVYRTLDLLVEQSLATRTNLGGDRAYYEPLAEHLHHHVVCERCGAIAHLHDDVLGGLAERVREASGYSLGSSELTFYGLCEDCS